MSLDFMIQQALSWLKDTPYAIPLFLAAAFFTAAAWAARRLKKTNEKIGVFAMAVGASLGTVSRLPDWNRPALRLAAGVLICLPALLRLLMYLQVMCQLKKVDRLTDKRSQDCDNIAALRCLDGVRTGWMTARQLRQYQKSRLSLLIELGSLRKAGRYLEETVSKDDVLYHFVRHFLAFPYGNVREAEREIQLAEDVARQKTDPKLSVQIIINHGVCYAAQGKYQLADESFQKARKYYDDHHLKDKELLSNLYYNYTFNKTRIDGSGQAWRAAVDEYRALLDLSKVSDQLDLLNLRLELFQQVSASREEIDSMVHEAVQKIAGSGLPPRQRVLFAASAARVAWAARLDPNPCLKILHDETAVFASLSPAQRLHLFRQLDLLFKDLHGGIVERYAELKQTTERYQKTERGQDLEAWRASLPIDAVYARGNCLKDLTTFQKEKPEYDKTKVLSYLYDAIHLYGENDLRIEEHQTRLDVIDELYSSQNADENFRPKYMEEIREQLAAVEAVFPASMEPPNPALFDLRLSYYCLWLDEYEKAVKYYLRFKNDNTSIYNFAPWVRNQYTVILLAVRVLFFRDAIEKVRTSRDLSLKSREVQEWFRSFPAHDGVLDSMLLARHLRCPVVKTKLWMPDGGESPQSHTWLWIESLNLNIDLTYPQYANDDLHTCVFFHMDRHPFESGSSLALRSMEQDSGMRFETGAHTLLEEHLTPDGRKVLNEVYDLVVSQLPADCPTHEEFLKLFQETYMPVPMIKKAEAAAEG